MTAFTGYHFRAGLVGASQPPTSRTLPIRLSDVVNVKDWGAVGDGNADDTTAIRNAVAHAWSIVSGHGWKSYGAIVFLPPGTYKVTGAINLNPPTGDAFNSGLAGIRFLGAGRDATVIKGQVDGGPILYGGTSHAPTIGSLVLETEDPGSGMDVSDRISDIEDMTVWNTSTVAWSRAIWFKHWGSAQLVKNVRVKAMIGIGVHFNAFHCAWENIIAECVLPIGRADSATPGLPANTIGFWGGPVGEVFACRASGFDCGFAFTAYVGGHVAGCRAENCNIGIAIGANAGNFFYMPGISACWVQGCVFQGNVIENCKVGVQIAWSYGCLYCGNVVKGIDGVAGAAPIYSMSWSSGTVTVTTGQGSAQAHNIAQGSGKALQLAGIRPRAWAPVSTDRGDGAAVTQNITANVNGATTFTYPLAGNPTGTPFTSGSWNYPLQHSLSGSCVQYSEFLGNAFDADVSGNSIYLLSGGETHRNTFAAMRLPYGLGANNLPGIDMNLFDFVNCGMLGARAPTEVAPVKFDSLARETTPKEGYVRNVSDCAAQLSFNGIVSTGGSNNKYKLRYDGTNWRRIG
jgi:hypothetical protein